MIGEPEAVICEGIVFEEMIGLFTGMLPWLSVSELIILWRAFYPPLLLNAKPRRCLTQRSTYSY
ncbi:hypothetical protein OS31_38250 [Dickeya oryzae]